MSVRPGAPMDAGRGTARSGVDAGRTAPGTAPSASATLTRVTAWDGKSLGALTKRIGTNGSAPQPAAIMKAAPIDLGADPHAGLVSTLDTMPQSDALVLGAPLVGDHAWILSKAVLAEWERRGATPKKLPVTTRTLDAFDWRPGPGWLLIDFDDAWLPPALRADALAAVAGLAPGAERTRALGKWLRGKIALAAPALGQAAWVVRASTSAAVLQPDKSLLKPDALGLHAYIHVSDAREIGAGLRRLHERLWLHDLAWKAPDRAGSALNRSLVDATVGSAERLIYEAEPILTDGHTAHPGGRPAVILDGDREAVDLASAVPAPTGAEVDRIDAAKQAAHQAVKPEAERVLNAKAASLAARDGITQAQARKRLQARLEGSLSLLDTVWLDDGSEVRVGDLVADPDRYDGADLCDPAEPDYSGWRPVARFYANRGEPRPASIFSFAHGGRTFRIDLSPEAIRAAARAGLDPVAISRVVAPSLKRAVRLGRYLREDGWKGTWRDLRPGAHCALVQNANGRLGNRLPLPQAEHALRSSVEQAIADTTGGAHVLAVEGGLGKTHVAAKVTAGWLIEQGRAGASPTVVFAVPTHSLGAEVLGRFRKLAKDAGDAFRVRQRLGASAADPEPADGAEDVTMCRRLADWNNALAAGLNGDPLRDHLCHGGGSAPCPFRHVCGLRRQERAVAAERDLDPLPTVVVTAHAGLFEPRPRSIDQPSITIVDEAIHANACPENGARWDRARLSGTAMLYRADGDVVGIDAWLADRARLVDLLDRALARGDRWLHREDVAAAGIDAATARAARKREEARRIEPERLWAPGVVDANSLAAQVQRDADSAAALWRALAGFVEEGGERSGRLRLCGGALVSAQPRRLRSGWLPTSGTGSLVFMDAQAPSDEIIRSILPRGQQASVTLASGGKADAVAAREMVDLGLVPEDAITNSHGWRAAPITRTVIAVEWPDDVVVRQILGAPSSKTRLGLGAAGDRGRGADEGAWNRAALRRLVWQKAAEHHPGEVLVVTHKALREHDDWQRLPPNVTVQHFNNISGRDAFKGASCAIVIGRPRPAADAIADAAATLSGQPVEADAVERAAAVPILLRDGFSVEVGEAERHEHALAEALRWSASEAEAIQAILRMRPCRRAGLPGEIVIVGDAALSVPVNEVVPWDPDALAPRWLDQWIATGVAVGGRAAVMAMTDWPERQAREAVLPADAGALGLDVLPMGNPYMAKRPDLERPGPRRGTFRVKASGARTSPWAAPPWVEPHEARARVESAVGALALWAETPEARPADRPEAVPESEPAVPEPAPVPTVPSPPVPSPPASQPIHAWPADRRRALLRRLAIARAADPGRFAPLPPPAAEAAWQAFRGG